MAGRSADASWSRWPNSGSWLKADQRDQAMTQARAAAGIAVALNSDRVVSYLGAFRAQLGSRARDAEIADFDELSHPAKLAMHVVLSGPGQREHPQPASARHSRDQLRSRGTPDRSLHNRDINSQQMT